MNQIDELTEQLASLVTSLEVHEQVDALNRIRTRLHEVGPFFGEPVDLVLWWKNDRVVANDYNPNAVAPPEMRLLEHSIRADGYTQPIVAYPRDDVGEVVDGYHRNRVGREVLDVRQRVHGFLPLAFLKRKSHDKTDRMAATVRHNRARGKHHVEKMSDLVRELYERGWSDEQIQRELGMQLDEVTRLKQITGLAALFKDREFSEAWEPRDPDYEKV